MALGQWSSPDRVGFSKKHDAPLPVQHSGLKMPSWPSLRRKRLMWILLACILVFVFVKNIPTDLKPVTQRYDRLGNMAPGHVQAHAGLVQALNEGIQKSNTGQRYEGTILFKNLAVSLRPHIAWSSNNNNILLAIAELSSLSNLVPAACEMALNNRSTVHVALLGRQDVSVERVLSLNGLTVKGCPVIWHDARPDHALDSSEERIRASVRAGFGHCITALRPQAALLNGVVVGGMATDKSLRDLATDAGIPIVTLNGDIMQTLPWITALDSSSLRRLENVQIEIVIHAYSQSAGSLIRLLRSLEKANYNSLFFPRLTIELPTQVDSFLSNYLEKFRWPPGSLPSASQLTLRHRLVAKRPTMGDASLRMVESFYPPVASTSHVLLLSPNAEVSPFFMHYLMFTLLEYRYGQNHDELAPSLFGISLELPDAKLTGERPFIDKLPSGTKPLLLSQAPSDNALLITGDGWIDLHTFLAARMKQDIELAHKSAIASSVTHDHPAWLAEMLGLMQARNQFVLYPAFATKRELKLVTVHKDLHQPPEEYAKERMEDKGRASFDVSKLTHDDVLTSDMNLPVRKHDNTPTAFSFPLQILLPRKKKTDLQRGLPSLKDIPMFSFRGQATDWQEARSTSAKFAEEFSLQQGGCKTLDARNQAKMGTVDFLFCEAE